MYLFLVRHGEAKPIEEDPRSGLTEKGAAAVKRAARFLKNVLNVLENANDSKELKEPLTIKTIWHSDKDRAVQTASILAETLGMGVRTGKRDGLLPMEDVSIICNWLDTEDDEAVVLVGHLPHLERLAGILLIGDAENEFVHFTPGSILCLQGSGRHWQLKWMVTPEILL